MPGTLGALANMVGKEEEDVPPFPIPPFPLPVKSLFEFVLTEVPPFELIAPAITLVFIATTELPVLLFKLSPLPVLVPPLKLPELAALDLPEFVLVFKGIELVLSAPIELLEEDDGVDEVEVVEKDEEVEVEVEEVDEGELDDPALDELGFIRNWLRSRLYFLKS